MSRHFPTEAASNRPIPREINTSHSLDQTLIKVLEATPVAMIISRVDGSLEYVNPALNQMLGYSGNEIFQDSVVISHPSNLSLNRSLRNDLRNAPFAPITIEKKYLHKTGQVILGLLTIVAQADDEGLAKHFIAQIVDITQKKKEEESLWLLTQLVEHSHDAIYVADPLTGNFLDCNHLAYERLGYTRNEILNMNVKDVSHALPNNAAWLKIVERAKGSNLLQESLHTRKNGSTFPVEASVSFVRKGDVAYMLSIVRDITVRKQHEAVIWKQANFDPLTNLANRRLLRDRLRQAIKRAKRDRNSIATLCLDLDFFKEVNDSLGHQKGDLLLIEIARRLKSCIRDSDTLARQGGDEFTIVLGGLKEKSDAERVAKEILSILKRPFHLGQESIYISASIGISLYPRDGITPDTLFNGADQAMYSAKAQGRNCFSFFMPAMHESAVSRIGMIRDLRLAKDGGQLQLYYQPIVDLSSAKIHKAEALLRWKHPRLGMMPPEQFIQLAEETLLISDIGNWVFQQAAAQAAIWRKHLTSDFQISINTSPLQYLDSSKKIEDWIPFLKTNNIPAQSITVEITESILMNTHTEICKQLEAFHRAGIAVALDDFGTGYSSLAYLKNFDIDYVKIDKLFVKDIFEGSDGMILCEAIIEMAHKLGIKVIAEGIETPAQKELLARAGCDYGQGYLFSKAIPAKEFAPLIHQINRRLTAVETQPEQKNNPKSLRAHAAHRTCQQLQHACLLTEGPVLSSS